jgi:hypothetical protein
MCPLFYVWGAFGVQVMQFVWTEMYVIKFLPGKLGSNVMELWIAGAIQEHVLEL